MSQATTQEQRITELEHKLQEKEEACAALQRQLDIERFGLTRFSNDNSMISFYTGFTSYITFFTFFNCIKPVATNMQSAYYIKSCRKKKEYASYRRAVYVSLSFKSRSFRTGFQCSI